VYKIELCDTTPAGIRHNLVGRTFDEYEQASNRVSAVPSGISMFFNIVPVNDDKEIGSTEE